MIQIYFIKNNENEFIMKITDEENLNFYRNGAAVHVLKRFEFTEKEEKLIRDAIRTANMTYPRMKLIHQADSLLKEVAKTRKPILPDTPTEVPVEALNQIELLNLKKSKKELQEDGIGEVIKKYKLGILLLLFVSILTIIAKKMT